MIDIFTHAQWCGHCKFNVDVETHHETCEFAALKKEVEKLRAENFRLREFFMASYAPRAYDPRDPDLS